MTGKKDNLVDGKYSIKDLLDLKKLQQIFEIFAKATGATIGLASYPSQEILVAAGWKDICTKFHRRNPESAQCCLESNISMTRNLKKPGDISIVKCANGLVDGAMPIIIKRKHIATLASGQVFFQPPDIGWFKKQAKKYGYDVEAYLKAVKEVRIPAPSPVLGSAPVAPLWASLFNTSSPCLNISFDLSPLILHTNPTPHESFSKPGS